MKDYNVFELKGLNLLDLESLFGIKEQLIADSRNLGINNSVTVEDPTFMPSWEPNSLCVIDVSYAKIRGIIDGIVDGTIPYLVAKNQSNVQLERIHSDALCTK